jgi:hypothetical protein
MKYRRKKTKWETNERKKERKRKPNREKRIEEDKKKTDY